MKNICGYIFKSGILLLCTLTMNGQDTLRTYGPRIGIDLARFAYLFATPSQKGAGFSVDAELYKNTYPVFELGYNQVVANDSLFDYQSAGIYARIGLDYNLLDLKDRSVHHAITVGFRYGLSVFQHQVENAVINSGYWGDMIMEPYENNLAGHWLELVGGIKTEVAPNCFLGWSVRYKILLNPEMDPLVPPQLVPGYGNGRENRGFGFSYSILYKIPLIKK